MNKILIVVIIAIVLIFLINHIYYSYPYHKIYKLQKINIEELKTGDLCLFSSKANTLVKGLTASFFNHVGVIIVLPLERRIHDEDYIYIWDISIYDSPRIIKLNDVIQTDYIYIKQLKKSVNFEKIKEKINNISRSTIYSRTIYIDYISRFLIKLKFFKKIKSKKNYRENICSELVVELYNQLNITNIDMNHAIFPKDLGETELKNFDQIKHLFVN